MNATLPKVTVCTHVTVPEETLPPEYVKKENSSAVESRV